MGDAPSVKADSVENTVIRLNELIDSTLDEAQRLRPVFSSVLTHEEGQDTADEGHPPHQVKVIADLEVGYRKLLQVRYLIRELLDHSAL